MGCAFASFFGFDAADLDALASPFIGLWLLVNGYWLALIWPPIWVATGFPLGCDWVLFLLPPAFPLVRLRSQSARYASISSSQRA